MAKVLQANQVKASSCHFESSLCGAPVASSVDHSSSAIRMDLHASASLGRRTFFFLGRRSSLAFLSRLCNLGYIYFYTPLKDAKSPNISGGRDRNCGRHCDCQCYYCSLRPAANCNERWLTISVSLVTPSIYSYL